MFCLGGARINLNSFCKILGRYPERVAWFRGRLWFGFGNGLNLFRDIQGMFINRTGRSTLLVTHLTKKVADLYLLVIASNFPSFSMSVGHDRRCSNFLNASWTILDFHVMTFDYDPFISSMLVFQMTWIRVHFPCVEATTDCEFQNQDRILHAFAALAARGSASRHCGLWHLAWWSDVFNLSHISFSYKMVGGPKTMRFLFCDFLVELRGNCKFLTNASSSSSWWAMPNIWARDPISWPVVYAVG